ncbi:MAG TPA: hypothetical protein VM261_32475 [Kofleriaceae bacterium]|nr:hypothetical protein [Kofleriaceae bacterium]
MRRLRLTLFAVVLLWPALAAADRRSFTRTYEYMTMPRGETEVEVYTTQSQATFDDDSPEAFELQLEIEHGITDRWDVSLYHVFDQSTGNGTVTDPGEPFHFSEMKLRTRYRFSERGELPVDPVAYLEAVKVFGGSVYEVEAKAILARDFGMVTVALNPIVELVFGGDVPEPEVELGWAAGVTYEARPTLKIGAETWGGFEAEAIDEAAASAGPSVSWAPSSSFWIATTVGFGLNDSADRFSVRGLLGMHI